MRVLGVDPGLTRCGIGVVEGVAGRPLAMRGVGVVRTPADAEIPDRLVLVERGIEEWLDEHRPDCVAVERVFSQHNVRTVMGTAQASAVAMLCAARRGLPVALHTPSEVKAAVTGSGRADKAQVGAMVTRVLRLAELPKPADAADALALAICHIWRAPATGRLQRAQADARARYRAAQAAGAARAAGPGPRQPVAGRGPVSSRRAPADSARGAATVQGAGSMDHIPLTRQTAAARDAVPPADRPARRGAGSQPEEGPK